MLLKPGTHRVAQGIFSTAMHSVCIGYGSIAKWLHWATAILFLASYSSIYYRRWFTEVKSFESMIAFQLHLSVGVTIAVIVVLRIVWHITNQTPDPEPGTFLEQWL